MRRQLSYLMLAFVMCISLLGIGLTPSPVSAQASTPTPTATSTPQVSDPLDHVTFAQLGQPEINLVGPYDRAFFNFNLPGNWKLKEGAELDLSLGVSITRALILGADAAATQTASQPVVSGGTLTVQLNGNIIADVPLTQVGDLPFNIKVPLSAFTSTRTDGTMQIGLTLNSNTSCELYNDQLDVVVRTGSSFNLPHDLAMPNPSLVYFPRPIIQGSFVPDAAVFVLPDKPTAADLQAALTLAAGLGNLSNQNLITSLTTLGKLTADQKASMHLILIGKAAALPIFGELPLPLKPAAGKFQTNPGSPDDGVVQMVNSPWNPAGVILAVTGNTDAGLLKAAQAISTGFMRTYTSTNLAIVDKVQESPAAVFLPVDQTLIDLGYDVATFENKGLNTVTYRFNVPPGWVAAPDANFELAYGHSKLLNYERSGLVVLLNSQPIGSARFTDVTADKSINTTQILIPPSLVRPGTNTIEVRANIEPIDHCSPRTMRGMWVTVWGDSRLHMPINQAPIKTGVANDLALYPMPFTYASSLNETAFVVPQNDMQSWNAALQIAGMMGNAANGVVSMPAAFFADQVPAAERAKYNMLVIGRPSQLPLITEINDQLPAPFATGSEAASEASFQVTYRIPVDSPSGYIQLLASPWNPDRVIVAVLGKQADGLGWAVNIMTTPTLRSQLVGNFAVAFNATQFKSTDTRISPLTSGSLNTASAATAQPAQPAATQPVVTTSVASRTDWILPVLGISVVLLLVLLIAVFAGGRQASRTTRR